LGAARLADPALLIAFALTGQIATSAEIRAWADRTAWYVYVFAAATYYLQWLYIAHHMPALQLAQGVRESWQTFATVMRDAAIWIIPALLPLSTLLYTFSSKREVSIQVQATTAVPTTLHQVAELCPFYLKVTSICPVELATRVHTAQCKACGWTKKYNNPESATRDWQHIRRHCTAMHPQLRSMDMKKSGLRPKEFAVPVCFGRRRHSVEHRSDYPHVHPHSTKFSTVGVRQVNHKVLR
jgi:hypothetical protein